MKMDLNISKASSIMTMSCCPKDTEGTWALLGVLGNFKHS